MAVRSCAAETALSMALVLMRWPGIDATDGWRRANRVKDCCQASTAGSRRSHRFPDLARFGMLSGGGNVPAVRVA